MEINQYNMDINQYNYIYPVLLDKSKSKSDSFIKINKSEVELIIKRGNRPFFLDYDLFTDVNNNLFLAVTGLPKGYCYELLYDNKSYSINAVEYKIISNLLDLTKESLNGIFTYVNSKPIVNRNSGRCDISMNGPSVFVRSDDVLVSNVFNSTFISGMAEIKTFQPIISVDQIGHIIYIKYDIPGKEEFDVNENNMPKAARTISELLKLMIEWKLVLSDPWNSDDEISSSIDLFFNALNIDSNIQNEIINSQCDMQIVRYLKGDTNARTRPPTEDIQNISSNLRKWISSFFFYRNIDEIYDNIVN